MKRAPKKTNAKKKNRHRKNTNQPAKSSAAAKRSAKTSAKTAAKRTKAKASPAAAKLNRRKLAATSDRKTSSSAKPNGSKRPRRVTPQDPKKEIEEIKKQLRHQITTGKDVTNLNDDQALEARSLQMRIAQLEAAVARVETADATPGLEMKVRAKTEDLKTRLKDD